ncbi:flagellar assembly protein FliX [Rhodovarius crocodyli]|nr:flagellar assembly protein FliX [Rhodovarius crocodyli]
MTMRVQRSQGAKGAAAAYGAQASQAGFRLPGAAPQPVQVASLGSSLPLAALAGGHAPSPRDAVAQRRARGLLGGLSALQRELLGGPRDDAALQRLVDLLEGEDGDDPALREAVQDLALRARIELLRRGLDRARDQTA